MSVPSTGGDMVCPDCKGTGISAARPESSLTMYSSDWGDYFLWIVIKIARLFFRRKLDGPCVTCDGTGRLLRVRSAG